MQGVKKNLEDDEKDKVKCWEIFTCNRTECPAYMSKDLRCWLISGACCRDEIQGKFLEKMEVCLKCDVFKVNMDIQAMKETAETVHEQFKEFRQIVDERGKKLKHMSIELALSLSQTFEAFETLKNITTEMIESISREISLRAEESEQKYRIVFESTGHATVIVEEDMTLSLANTKFEELSGYSKEEIEGKKSLLDFFLIEDRDILEAYHRIRRNDPTATPKNQEARFVDKHGQIRYVLLTVSVIPGTKKIIESLLDITERKKIEEQMYHTEKLASIGTIAAGVAHDINNPLSIILGFTDILLEKVPRDSEAHGILETIEKQGIHAKKVVENLLSFSRFKEPKEEKVDINKNIETVLAFEGNTLSINNISVKKDMTGSLPLIKGEPNEFQQIFFNVINNSVAAMKGGGVLTIVTRSVENGQSVEIRISDTGTGIEKKNRAKVFEPFFTTKQLGEGTGLGLTIVYSLVAKHGGSVAFDTKTKEESEKTGTTFILTFPSIEEL